MNLLNENIDMLRSLYQICKTRKVQGFVVLLKGTHYGLSQPQGKCEYDKMLNEIREFFTFRPGQPGYGCDLKGMTTGHDWIAPLHGYVKQEDGTGDGAVGVARMQMMGEYAPILMARTYGRSYTLKDRFSKL